MLGWEGHFWYWRDQHLQATATDLIWMYFSIQIWWGPANKTGANVWQFMTDKPVLSCLVTYCTNAFWDISWFYSSWLPAGGFEFDSYPNKNSKLVHFQEYEHLYFFWPLINNFVKNWKEPLMVLTPVPDCLQIIEILRPVGLLPRLGLPFNRPYCTWISHEDDK